MQRNYDVYLEDIEIALVEIFDFTKNVNTLTEFKNNKILVRAVERNLEIIGEAVKSIPTHIRDCSPSVEWKKIAGLRDIIIHAYFDVNPIILWDIVHEFAPSLLVNIRTLRQNVKNGHCT